MNISIDDLDGQLLDGLEFCAKAYALFEKLRSELQGRERLRLRSGLNEKRLVEEILPICRYIQTYYRLGRYISVRWANGSQSYDAELYQRGDYVTKGYYPAVAYLEATGAMHENEHWIRKLLSQGKVAYAPEGIDAKKGTTLQSKPIVFRNDDHVQNFVPIIVESIQKKSEINYPDDTSLVVQCHLNSLYTPNDWQQLVSEVESQVAFAPFREILLVDGTTERTTSLAINMR